MPNILKKCHKTLLLITKKISRLSALLVQRSWDFRAGEPEAGELEMGLEVCVGNVENAMNHPSISHSLFVLATVVLFVHLLTCSGQILHLGHF